MRTHTVIRGQEGTVKYEIGKQNRPCNTVILGFKTTEQTQQEARVTPNIVNLFIVVNKVMFLYYFISKVYCLPGKLTKADRELIVVATSIHNKCLYCVVSHSALHRIYSKKPTLSDQVLVK